MKMKWLDLSAHGVALIPVKVNTGKTALVLVGDSMTPDCSLKESLKGLKFIANPRGYFWFSQKYSTPDGLIKGLNPTTFKKVFPKAVVREMTMDEIKSAHKNNQQAETNSSTNSTTSPSTNGQNTSSKSVTNSSANPNTPTKSNQTGISTKAAKDIEVDLNQIKPVGMNELGEKVFQNAGERFVVDGAGKKVFESSGYFANARYLRAGRVTSVDGAALSSCMHGLVQQVKTGSVLGLSDIENSAKVFFDIQNWEGMNQTTRKSITKFIQIAIESAIVKETETGFYSYGSVKGKTADEASAMYERRPTYVDKNEWHRDLPPDIALLVNDLVTSEQKNILLPFANQGSNILSILKNGQDKSIRALMDFRTPSFAAHFKIGSGLNIAYDKFNYNTDNLADKSVDFITGAMPASASRTVHKIEGEDTQRLDHYYAFKMLNALKENGRAVITVESDGYDGEVTDESNVFMQWLYANFKVDSIADIDGGIYSKSGEYNASRLIVIDGRHLVPVKRSTPKEVDVLRKRSDLVGFMEATHERLNGVSSTYSEDETLDTETLSQAMARVQSSRGEDIQINEYQARYISMSSISEVDSMVPKNLAEPIRMCFARFMKDAGTVDEFVKEKLQMTDDEMFIAFSPEQIDSIGLAIWRHEFKDKGFLVSDQTGKGKGRILAGLMRYAALNDMKTVFLTKDSGLHQDIWRDITDIGSAHLFDPYLVNDKAVIVDEEGNEVAKGSNKNNQVYIQNDSVPANNLILSSYSQLNSRPKTEKINNVVYTLPNKPQWHKTLVDGAVLMLDESHLAAGQSNTNKIVDAMLDKCAMTTYSSATFARHAKSMAIYRKLFPDELSPAEIQNALVKGKEPLQEILSATLVADGGMLRREHDFSRLSLGVVQATQYKTRNEEACDAFARFLSGFALLTGDIDGASQKVNKSIINNMIKAQMTKNSNAVIKTPSTKDIGYQSMSFGSQLHNITKQFIVALNVDVAADRAILAVQQGRKPVIGVENTGESLLKHIKEISGNVEFDHMPSIRDLFKRVVQRNMMVTYIDPLTNKRCYKDASELFDDPVKKQYLKDQINQVLADIDKIPALPFSPIDSIIQKVEKAGIKIGEISGRNLHVTQTDTGYAIETKKKVSKNDVVDAFNAGYLDAVITTKSGATGISMHAYIKFADQNQRELIECQIFDDIIDRVQLLGRVNRKGQVVEPMLTSIDAMVPAQTRLLAMANSKLARLSANTTANRDNSSQLDTIDILNNVGDTVCQRYLESNPSLRKKLFLKEEDIEDKNLQKGYENSLSRIVTSRLLLLSVAEQNDIYQDLDYEFNAYIRECESQGYNPLKRRELDVGATEVKRQRFSGASKTFYESEFDRPVEIITLEYDVKRNPLTTEDIMTMIDNGRRRVFSDVRLDAQDECLMGLVQAVEKAEKSILQETFKNEWDYFAPNAQYSDKEYKEILDERLNAKGINSTKKLHDIITWLKEKLEIINVGSLIEFSTYFNDVKGVVTDIRLPRAGNEHMLAQYELTIATPQNGVETRSLADLYQGEKSLISIEEFEPNTVLSSAFDRAKGSSYSVTRHLLAGNMFEAARFAAEKNFGRPIIYTDNTGARHPGVLLSAEMTPSKLLRMPFTLDSTQAAADYLRCHPKAKLVNSLEYKYNKDLSIHRDPRDSTKWKVTVPNNKTSGQQFFASNTVSSFTINGWTAHNRNQVAQISDRKLQGFLSAVYGKGVRLYTPNNARDWMNDYKEGKVQVPVIGQTQPDQTLNAVDNTTNNTMAPV